MANAAGIVWAGPIGKAVSGEEIVLEEDAIEEGMVAAETGEDALPAAEIWRCDPDKFDGDVARDVGGI